MAETDTLLEKRPLNLPHNIGSRSKKIYSSFCIPFKGALLVLIWSVLIHSSGTRRIIQVMSQQLNYLTISNGITPIMIISSATLVTFLLYPVAGLLAETWFSRFKFLIAGTIVVMIGIIILIVPASMIMSKSSLKDDSEHLQHSITVSVLLVTGIIILRIGQGMFEANVIQFGVDQLQFASNEELSKFVHWYYWTLYVLQYTLTSIIPTIPYTKLFLVLYYVKLFLPQTVFSLLCCCAALLIILYCSYRGHLLIEPTSTSNPVTLIYKVLNYARHHSQPERRSAFTYGDPPPSRLDVAKERYGGPFTTEQVEDVKSFWRIAGLLVTLFGVSVTSEYDNFGRYFFRYPTDQNKFSYFSVFYSATLVSSGTIYYSVIIFGIPLYMCLLRPCLGRRVPSMLKRIGIGLLMLCLQLTLYTASKGLILQGYNNNDNVTCTPIYSEELLQQSDTESTISLTLLLIAQFFYGLGITLVFLTSLEFILAQAPRTMQGLLIGLWYAYQSIGVSIYMLTALPIESIQCNYWLYIVKTVLALISFIVYVFVARRFKYRTRDEPSNINYQTIIEEYTQKQLDNKTNYDAKQRTRILQDTSSDYIIHDYN